MLKPYQQQFIKIAKQYNILSFGEFILKSGRKSDYFFNLGKLSDGQALAEVADCFCALLAEAPTDFDLLFGPAYKGIPLVTSIAVLLYHEKHRNVPFAYSRKEKKDHGEGGQIVGDIAGKKILIVDDVLTAGTAAQESLQLIRAAGGIPVGLLVALDREETAAQSERLARDLLQQEWGITVRSIVRGSDLKPAAC